LEEGGTAQHIPTLDVHFLEVVQRNSGATSQPYSCSNIGLIFGHAHQCFISRDRNIVAGGIDFGAKEQSKHSIPWWVFWTFSKERRYDDRLPPDKREVYICSSGSVLAALVLVARTSTPPRDHTSIRAIPNAKCKSSVEES
jgi:hypothetical protein